MAYKDYDIPKYFRVKEMLNKIKEEKRKLNLLEDEILEQNGFPDRRNFNYIQNSLRNLVEEEAFNQSDKKYIAELQSQLPEILYKI